MNERLNIHEAAIKADALIDTSRENIPAEQKIKIAEEEKKIRSALTNFRPLPDYADIIQNFKQDPDSEGHPPEDFLRLLTQRFEGVQKETAKEAHAKLEWLGQDTLAQLQDIKQNLGNAAAENERLNVEAQKMYESLLPPYDGNPSQVTDHLREIGETIGQMPNVDKMASAEFEFNSLLVHLRKKENSSQYAGASVNFKTVSGGKALESLKKDIDQGIKKVAAIAGTDPEGAKRALLTRYSAAMDTFNVAIDVMSRSLVEDTDAGHEEMNRQALTDGEIQYILTLLLHGSKDPSFLDQLFDAEEMYSTGLPAMGNMVGVKINGKTYEQMNTAEKFLISGVGQGVGNMGSFMGSLVIDTRATLTGLAEGAGSLFQAETRAQLGQVLKEGFWEKMPRLEKTLLITQMVTDMLSGGYLEGGVGAALQKVLVSSKFAGVTRRMGTIARSAGLAENASQLALAVSPMLKQCPRLARFGTSTKEIVKNLALDAKILAQRLKIVAGKVEGPARDITESTSTLTSPVTKAVLTRSDISQYLPSYADKAALEKDLKIAVSNAQTLGISPQELVTIRSALQTLQTL